MTVGICIKNASLSFNNRLIFSKLDLTVPAGKWIALLGPSGIGKSSLLRMVAGLTKTDETVYFQISTDNQLSVQQQAAYMAQTDLLMPWLNVLDNATLSLRLRSHSREDYQQKMESAKTLLERVGLQNAIKLYPHQLSGGMRQRVALVRTLIEDKPIVLMDEPFSSLDAITRYKLQELSAELLKDKTVLFITHDPSEALRLANEIVVMQGEPAFLQSVALLSSAAPRELADPQLVALQATLFNQLSQAGMKACN